MTSSRKASFRPAIAVAAAIGHVLGVVGKALKLHMTVGDILDELIGPVPTNFQLIGGFAASSAG